MGHGRAAIRVGRYAWFQTRPARSSRRRVDHARAVGSRSSGPCRVGSGSRSSGLRFQVEWAIGCIGSQHFKSSTLNEGVYVWQVVAGGEEARLNVQSGLGPRGAEEGTGAGGGGREWDKAVESDEAPYDSVQLEHVYGYRGHDARNNLVYNRDGKIVYMAGTPPPPRPRSRDPPQHGHASYAPGDPVQPSAAQC